MHVALDPPLNHPLPSTRARAHASPQVLEAQPQSCLLLLRVLEFMAVASPAAAAATVSAPGLLSELLRRFVLAPWRVLELAAAASSSPGGSEGAEAPGSDPPATAPQLACMFRALSLCCVLSQSRKSVCVQLLDAGVQEVLQVRRWLLCVELAPVVARSRPVRPRGSCSFDETVQCRSGCAHNRPPPPYRSHSLPSL